MRVTFLFSLLFVGILYGCNTSKPEIFSGSAAVCYAFPDAILIGADSKLVMDANGVEEHADAGKICKVHQKDSIIYAIVGAERMLNPDIDPARMIARLTLSKYHSLKDKITAIDKSICDSLTEMAKVARTGNTRYFYSKILDSGFITMVFGMFQDGQPTVGLLAMTCRMNKKGKVYLQDTIILHDNAVGAMPLGHTEYFDSITRTSYLAQFDVKNRIDIIIIGQSRMTPKIVNDQPSVILLLPTGVISWLERRQECN